MTAGRGRSSARRRRPAEDGACDAGQTDVERLFSTISLIASAMTDDRPTTGLLDEGLFDDAVDHLLIVRPASNTWRSRFEFVGSTVAETSTSGDVTGMTFGDILSDVITPAVLNPYAHVARTCSAHVTRNFALAEVRPRLFTRYILPLFHGDQVALMLGAIVFHQAPLGPGSVRPASVLA